MPLISTYSSISYRGWFNNSSIGWGNETIIIPFGANASDYVGNSVAVNSDATYAVIGAPGTEVANILNCGTAYVYVNNNSIWTQQQQISASDKALGDNFGCAVDISGDSNYIIVGSSNDDSGNITDCGSAYVFVRSGNTWTQQQKLVANNESNNSFFGSSVAINNDGTKVIIGAPFKTISGNIYQGAAYFFTRTGNTWTQTNYFTGVTSNDFFGKSVAISGDGLKAAVGTNKAVYTYDYNGTTWGQQKIISSNALYDEEFGSAVSLNYTGNKIIIGAYFYEAATIGGAAYVYTRSGNIWNYSQRITASDSQSYKNFGYSLSLSSDGDVVIIGAYRDSGPNIENDVGSAYIFRSTNGSIFRQQQKLSASDKSINDRFGISVDIDNNGNTVIIGADQFYDSPASTGKAYIFNGN